MKTIRKIIESVRLYFYIDIHGRMELQTTVSAFFGAVSAVVKLLIAIALRSLVWGFSVLYALMVILARFLFFRGCREWSSDERQRYWGRGIAYLLAASAYLFNMLMLVRQSHTDSVRALPAWAVVIMSLYFMLMLMLGLRGMLISESRREPLFFAYRVIGLSGALVNLVLLQRMILAVTPISTETLLIVNSWIGYCVGVVLLLLSLWLWFFCRRK